MASHASATVGNAEPDLNAIAEHVAQLRRVRKGGKRASCLESFVTASRNEVTDAVKTARGSTDDRLWVLAAAAAVHTPPPDPLATPRGGITSPTPSVVGTGGGKARRPGSPTARGRHVAKWMKEASALQCTLLDPDEGRKVSAEERYSMLLSDPLVLSEDVATAGVEVSLFPPALQVNVGLAGQSTRNEGPVKGDGATSKGNTADSTASASTTFFSRLLGSGNAAHISDASDETSHRDSDGGGGGDDDDENACDDNPMDLADAVLALLPAQCALQPPSHDALTVLPAALDRLDLLAKCSGALAAAVGGGEGAADGGSPTAEKRDDEDKDGNDTEYTSSGGIVPLGAPTPSAIAQSGRALAERIAEEEARCSELSRNVHREAWATVRATARSLDLWSVTREAAQDRAKKLVASCSLTHADPPHKSAGKWVTEALDAAEAIKKPKEYKGNAREQKALRESQKCDALRTHVNEWKTSLEASQAAWHGTFLAQVDDMLRSLSRCSAPLWGAVTDAVRSRLDRIPSDHPDFAIAADAVKAAVEAAALAREDLDATQKRLEQLANDTFARSMEDIPVILEKLIGSEFDAVSASLREVKDKMSRVESKIEKKCRSECVRQLVAIASGPRLLASGIAVLRAAVAADSAIETAEQRANVDEARRLRAEFAEAALSLRQEAAALHAAGTRGLALAAGAVVFRKVTESYAHERARKVDEAILRELDPTAAAAGQLGSPARAVLRGAGAGGDATPGSSSADEGAGDQTSTTGKKKKTKKKKKKAAGKEDMDVDSLPPGMKPASDRPRQPDPRPKAPTQSQSQTLAQAQTSTTTSHAQTQQQGQPHAQALSLPADGSSSLSPSGSRLVDEQSTAPPSLATASLPTATADQKGLSMTRVDAFSVVGGTRADAEGGASDDANARALEAMTTKVIRLEQELAAHKAALAETQRMLSQATQLASAYARQLEQLTQGGQTQQQQQQQQHLLMHQGPSSSVMLGGQYAPYFGDMQSNAPPMHAVSRGMGGLPSFDHQPNAPPPLPSLLPSDDPLMGLSRGFDLQQHESGLSSASPREGQSLRASMYHSLPPTLPPVGSAEGLGQDAMVTDRGGRGGSDGNGARGSGRGNGRGSATAGGGHGGGGAGRRGGGRGRDGARGGDGGGGGGGGGNRGRDGTAVNSSAATTSLHAREHPHDSHQQYEHQNAGESQPTAGAGGETATSGRGRGSALRGGRGRGLRRKAET